MKNLVLLFTVVCICAGCNSVYLKPNTLDTEQIIFADRGGYSMRRSVKQTMEERGYKIIVGKAHTTKEWTDTEGDAEIDTTLVPTSAKYVVRVKERREIFRPVWCALNGFWWWNFNISIADQVSGEEILSWRGRGCANSSIRKLNHVLDQIEQK